ncbi:MAG: hypothetical protein WCA08_20215 [Desulfoferrobacter sp.]
MAVQYTNQKGQVYFLHQGKTKTGKPKYYFSMKGGSELIETIPDRYEVYENANAQVFLIREQPKAITDDERLFIEEQVSKIRVNRNYRIDIKGKVITIYESNENTRELRRMFEELSMYRSRQTTENELLKLLDRSTTYSPLMRFILEDEEKRLFSVQRYCFRGSVDDWIQIGGAQHLKAVVEKFIPHLGKESFFELF